MRYQRKDSPDWVVLKPGLARLTISEVYKISNTADLLAVQIESCHFENDSGSYDDLPTGLDVFQRLTFGQFDWLGKQVIASARDEALDPEV